MLFPHPTFKGIRFPPLCSRHPMYSDPCPACYDEDLASRTWIFLVKHDQSYRVLLPDGRICKEGDRVTCNTYLEQNGYEPGAPPGCSENIENGESYMRQYGWRDQDLVL